MENLTFKTWVLSQAHSFVIAMANALVNSQRKDLSNYNDFHNLEVAVCEDFTYDDYDDDRRVHVNTYGNYVVTINKYARKIGLLNTRSGKFVETYCNKKDEFDVLIGLGVLWAKYNHIERPKFPVNKYLSELKPHDIFTLYSPKCKYEFIGATNNFEKGETKYVAFGLHEDKTKDFFTFYDDICTVWE